MGSHWGQIAEKLRISRADRGAIAMVMPSLRSANKALAFLSLALATACATVQPETWSTPNTGRVVCQRYEQEPCGLKLAECGADKTVEFSCIHEATYFGPGDHPTVPADFAPDVAKGESSK